MQTYFQTLGPTLQIRNVRIFDGERVLEQRSVLVENGIISGITERDLHIQHAEVIDGRGRTLLPGLFDAHVHLADNPEPALRQAISLGVTTVLDMFNGTNLLEAKQR